MLNYKCDNCSRDFNISTTSLEFALPGKEKKYYLTPWVFDKQNTEEDAELVDLCVDCVVAMMAKV